MGKLKILQMNRQDTGGPATIARQLHLGYQRQGWHSAMVVAHKRGERAEFQVLNPRIGQHRWTRWWSEIAQQLAPLERHGRQVTRLRHLIEYMGQPKRLYEKLAGHEEFDFPATWRLLERGPFRPDILHLHNLHGHYFDLRALPWLSRQLPVVLTPHDAWLLTGHCSHFFDCNRWQTGCGCCPDLGIYPHLLRDGTAYNWQRKRTIYAQSHLYLSTPCHWLMGQVERSIVQEGIVEAQVIHNGVDLTIFRPPADRNQLRERLGIGHDVTVLLFTAGEIRSSLCKDYQTLHTAVTLAAAQSTQKILFLALGERGPSEQIGEHAQIRFIPYQTTPENVAQYYQIADIYLHAAKSETFPTVVMEAMACGVPVIATAVGGIPEQVAEGVTGFLTPCGDAKALADRIEQLLCNPALRRAFGENARARANARFDAEQMIQNYLMWYQKIIPLWQQFGANVYSDQSLHSVV